MELMLQRLDNDTVRVRCDGLDSHDFDLQPLLINTSGQERELMNNPVVYGKKVYERLFPSGSPAQLVLAEQPERILLVLDGSELDGVAWEYVYGPYGVSDPTDPNYIENFLVLECRFVHNLPARQRSAPQKIDDGLRVNTSSTSSLGKNITLLGSGGEGPRLCRVIGGAVTTEYKYQRLDHHHRKLYACIETSVHAIGEDLQRLTHPHVEHYTQQQYERDELLARFGAACYAVVDYLYDELDHNATVIVLAQQIRDDLERGEVYVSDKLQARYLCYLGWILYCLGNSQHGLQFLERAAEKVKETEISLKLSIANNLALVYHATGRPQEALRLYEEALVLRRKVGDRAGEATILHNLALIYSDMGRLLESLQLYEEALPLMQEVGDRLGEAATLNGLAAVYRATGRLQQALRLYKEALALRQQVGDRTGEATTLYNLALVYSETGKQLEALRLYEETLVLRRQMGDRAGEAATLNRIALIYRATGRQKEALRLYAEVLSLRREVRDRAGEAATLNGLAYLYQDMQRYKEAQAAFEQSVELSKRADNPAYEVAGLVGLALLLYHHLDDIDEAKSYMQQAITILQAKGLPQDAAGKTIEQIQRALEEMQRKAAIKGSRRPSILPAEYV